MDSIQIFEEVKQQLIDAINERVSDRVTERANADLIIKLINKAESSDEAFAIAELGTTYKRTGFHWDKRFDREQVDNTIRYLKKNDSLSFSDGTKSREHQLIIGDNYPALRNLLITSRSAIDVIYIDPPYGKDDMGAFAETNYNNSISRDNLLSQLYPRLLIAKELLTNDGVIFCSIDDKNQAYVKGLFDEVFGERNFMGSICREAIKGGTKTNNIKRVHDYILVYAKERFEADKEKTLLVGEDFVEEFNFSFSDDKGPYVKGRELNKWGAGSRREDSPTMWFPIPGPDDVEVYPIRTDGSEGRWRWGKKKLLAAVDAGEVHFEKRDNGTWVAYEKIRKNRTKNVQLRSFLRDGFENSLGSATLKEVLGTFMSSFDYAKPVELLKELIGYIPFNDCVVLDFYAGSGTTGHAVAELNQEDDGTRKFILVTNNEKTTTTPNGIAFDVTTKRLKRVMTGSCYDGSDDFPWLKEHQPYGGNLNVLEVAEVPDFISDEGKTPFDLIDEKIYGQDFSDSCTDKIQWVCENFDHTRKYLDGE